MKIALFVDSFLPTIGGRELVVHHLALQFKALGHQPTVLGAGGFFSNQGLDFPYSVIRCPSVPLIGKETPKKFLLRFAHMVKKFDIVHAHSTYPGGFVAAQLCRQADLPLVITPHGEDINVVADLGFGYRLDPALEPKVTYAVRHADRLTAISDTVNRSLQEAGAQEAQINNIPNGVDIGRFARPEQREIPDYGITSDSFVMLSIGNFHPRKGHEHTINALAKLQNVPNAKLIIVGQNTAKLQELVTRLDLDNQVVLAGSIKTPAVDQDLENDVLAKLLRRADVYISASTGDGAEGLSLALLEAMAANACPVVTNVSGNRDVIRDGWNGLVVEPGSAESIAVAIERVFTEPNLRNELASQAFATVTPYDWKNIAEQYIDCFEKLLENKHRRAHAQ